MDSLPSTPRNFSTCTVPRMRARSARTPTHSTRLFLDRLGNDAIQLNLLHNYQTNPPKYEGWHEFFRKNQPAMLIVWGKNGPFTVEGAQAYLKDLLNAELHLLDTGDFALEEELDFIEEI